METRRLGRTGHQSSVAIFGAFAIGEAEPGEVETALQLLLEKGVNHIDIAPSYAEAEAHLGPWMPQFREKFFLGCKTMERSQEGARAEMERSLERLKTESFDLYQIHAITTLEELDQATQTGGALDGMIRARDEGLTRFLGITGHGMQAPSIFLEALRRFDFDTILFPINAKLYADHEYRRHAQELLEVCQSKDVGTMIIKSVAKEPWGEHEHTHTTWYRPYTDPGLLQAGVNFVLSQPVTGLCTAGDLNLLPEILRACENYSRLSSSEQELLIQQVEQYKNIFT